MVKLNLVADITGIGLGAQQWVFLKSTDGTFNDTLVVNQVGGQYTVNNGCAYAVANNFQALVVVPKNKVIKMYYEACCRPSGFTALVNSASQSFYLEALIDGQALGQRGYDNAVQPLNIGPHRVISGAESYLPAFWSEPDGDSVNVSLHSAFSWNLYQKVGVPATYAAGYSGRQPIPTAGGSDSLAFLPGTHTFRVVPNAVGGSTIALRYTNYMWDSVSASYTMTGYSNAEYPVYMFASSNYNLTYSVLQSQVPNQIVFKTSGPHYTATYSGGEFGLKTIAGQSIPSAIDSVQFVNPNFGDQWTIYTDTNLLPGNYLLNITLGVDSNTLVGYCATALAPGAISVTLPFDTASISALWGGTGTGFYALSNVAKIDSITWSASGAILSQNGTTHGNQFSTTNFGPIWLSMSQPTGELRALRHGAGGATSLATFALTSGIGTDEPSVPQSSVYPNPTSGTASLVTDLVGTYELFSVFGALLERGAIPSELDFSRYPQGVYLLALTGDGRTETLRIVRN